MIDCYSGDYQILPNKTYQTKPYQSKPTKLNLRNQNFQRNKIMNLIGISKPDMFKLALSLAQLSPSLLSVSSFMSFSSWPLVPFSIILVILHGQSIRVGDSNTRRLMIRLGLSAADLFYTKRIIESKFLLTMKKLTLQER